MKTPFLSKSRFQSGRQCHKRLWLEIHRRELMHWDSAAEARFAEGTRFGELARDLLGGGALVDAEHFDAEKALAQTRDLLAQPVAEVCTLFEPAFEHDGVRIRADALHRSTTSERLVEVKSSTSVKDEYVWDCAIQTWVIRGAGRPLDEVRLAHIDNTFVYAREGEYDGLLTQTDITEEVEARLPEVPGIVSQLKTVVAGKQPEIATGAHCTTPYPCPFQEFCRSTEPPTPEHSVDDLPRAGKLIESLRDAGYEDLRDVPEHLLKNPVHRRIAQAAREGKTWAAAELTVELDAITFPRYYLDFETIAFVVPRWLGTRPFQQIPFQFSCHTEYDDGRLKHREHLDLSGASPIKAFSHALLAALGDAGPILVWNRGFEAARVRELATMLPNLSKPLLSLVERMVDLLPIYRAHYYHPDMHGSWSIKSVLPTIAPDLDYGALEIGDGGAAQEGYLRAIAPESSPEGKEALRRHLLAYCERDTLAMVRLAQWRPAPADTHHSGKPSQAIASWSQALRTQTLEQLENPGFTHDGRLCMKHKTEGYAHFLLADLAAQRLALHRHEQARTILFTDPQAVVAAGWVID